MKLTRIPNIKRICLAKKQIRKRRLYNKLSRFALSGGPICSAMLSTPGTLCFSLGEWRGYYNAKNEWVQL